MHLRRSFAAIVAAFALVLSVAGAAFAADQSVDVTQSITVNATTTLTVDASSVSFGTWLAGESTAEHVLNVAYASNNTAGISVDVAATDFTSGANTIAKANETASVDGGGATAVDGLNLADTSGPTAYSSHTVGLVVNVPAIAVSGVYGSTLTFTATEK